MIECLQWQYQYPVSCNVDNGGIDGTGQLLLEGEAQKIARRVWEHTKLCRGLQLRMLAHHPGIRIDLAPEHADIDTHIGGWGENANV